MRLLVVAGIFAFCVIGAAVAQEGAAGPQTESAQESGVYNTSNVQWEREPDLREAIVRYRPRRAADENVSGAALVCCTVDNRRRLDCETMLETTEGYGFGNASARVVRLYQMTEASYAEWQLDPRPIARTLRWYIGDPPYSIDAQQLASFVQQARGLCSAQSLQAREPE